MKKILLTLLITFSVLTLFAQLPGACPPGSIFLSNNCAGSCVACNFNTFVSNNANLPDGQQVPPDFCPGQAIFPHNVQWVGFVAGTSSITMDVEVGNCDVGEGLQIGIWGTGDCSTFNLVSNCSYQVVGGSVATYNMNNLVVGGTYFFVVDGFNDDVCDFTVNVVSGNTAAPPVTGIPTINIPPGPFCPNAGINASAGTVPFAGYYNWTLDGNPVGAGLNVNLDVSSFGPGFYELCVTPGNVCEGDGEPNCAEVEIVDLAPQQEFEVICQGDVFIFQGTPLTQAGTYTFTQPLNGCVQTIELTLEVTEPDPHFEFGQICQGDFVIFRGVPLSVAGDYEFPLPGQGVDGCDSLIIYQLETIPPTLVELGEIIVCDQFLPYEIEDGVTISTPGPFDILVPQPDPDCPIIYRGNLVVTAEETIIVDETICEGDVLTVQGSNFTEAGDYTLTFPEPGGCNIFYEISLDVYDPSTTLNPTICDGESFTVGTSSFDATGSYNVTLASTFMGLGCDSIVTLNLTVRDAIETYLEEEICEGESFQTGGQSFDATGMYSVVLEAENGCDSTVFLDLTVHPNVETVLNPELCFGETFEAGGQTFASTGTYTIDLMTSEGCDSTVTVNLTIKAPIVTELARDICEGETFSVGGTPFDATGTYEVILTAADGCDSTVILDLQVLNLLETELNEEVCAGGSFTIGSSTYSATGTYVENLTSVTGCDSIVTLNLVVPEPIETSLEEEICDDETVTIGAQSFNTTGNYVVTLQAENGCDSTVTLDLTVFPNKNTQLTPVLCFGETFEAGGQTFDASGSYTVPLSTADGCDSIVNVELTIKPEIRTVLDEAICQGESFTAAGNVYTETGSYEEVLTAADGCDSIVNLTLTVLDVPAVTLNEEVCFGEDFTVGSTTYTETGTYVDTLTAANGCDSIVTLNLIVPGPIINDIDRGICIGQSFTVGSSTYNTSGMYTDVLTAANGCDSTVNLTLTVDDVIRDTLVTSICEGETAFIDGTPYTETGFYSQDFVTATDCDSTFYLDLTVFATRITEIDSTICDGESVAIGGNTYTTTGNFEDVFQSVETGCDSIVRLDLTVLPVPRTSLVEDICEFEDFSVGSSTYDASGTYVDTLVAANGCDSIVTLELTVLPVPQVTLIEDICEFEDFSVGSSTYDASGTYVDTLVAANGCDSIVTLELTVLPVPQVTLTEEICEFESFSVGTSTYNASGTYVDTLVAANGCDSIVTLELTVFPLGRETLDITVCPGGTVQVGPNTYTDEGTYVDTLTSVVTGCDSIVTLNLSERDFFEINLNRTICEFESFTVGTTAYTETGMYSQTFTSQQGCDSIVNLNLTVVPLPRETISPVICEGEAFEIAGSTYSLAGTYLDTLTSSVSGCDSIVTTELTVLPTLYTQLDEEICDYESFTVGTSTYNTQGTFVDTLSSVVTGCDSIVTLNLTVHPTLYTELNEEICDYESFTVGSSTYNTQGTFMDTLSSVATGCDSIVTLNLSINPTLRTTLDEIVCFGDSFGVGSSTYSSSGTFMDTLSSVVTGCDSIITLNLTVREEIRTALTGVICDYETYTVGSSVYNTTGIHVDTLTALSNGCDSIVTLDLTVNPTLFTELNEEICDYESFSVGSSTYNTQGTFMDTLSSVVTGCDSIVTLNLTVHPTLYTELNEEICDYESFTVGSSTYNTQGTFMDTLSSVVTGCDSIVTLNLSINPTLRTTLTEIVCSGDSFGVGSSTYSTSGTFMDTLSSAVTGCDSIVTLNLTVREQIRTTLNEEICESGSFTVGGSTYTEAGTHVDTLTALANGCDSIVTLNLTVNPEYEISLQQDICDDESFTVGNESFSEAGTFTVALETAAGCDSIVTLELAVYPCELQFATQTTNVRCHGDADGRATFELLVGTPPYTYTWQAVPGGAPNGAGTIAGNNISEVLDQLPAGTYRIDVTDSSPFAITGSTTVTIGQPAPIDIELLLSEYNAFNLSCQGETDGYIEGIVTGGIPPYNYSWSNGSRLEEIDQLEAGVYSLTVTDANGCREEALATLVEPASLDVNLDVIDPLCFGDQAGRIIISGVSGGVSPYVYGLDGAPMSSQSQFTNLPIGSHLVQVQDANGCTTLDEVFIEEPQELTVDLGPDQEIKLGESLSLFAQTSYNVDQYLWDINQEASPSCLDCPNPEVMPLESMAFAVTVLDENNCRASDRITVFVNKARDVYFPNIFSPNGDGNNDFFTMFTGPDVVAVNSFRIYNRWGEPVFEAIDFPPNNPPLGWDGTYRGQLMNGAVFVYVAEIEFVDGEVIIFKGDVTLMR